MEFGEFVLCKTCGHWGFEETHKCPPRYGARFVDEEIREGHDQGEEWHSTYGATHSAAAVKFAEDMDRKYGYSAARDSRDVAVEVRGPENARDCRTVIVRCTLSPCYREVPNTSESL